MSIQVKKLHSALKHAGYSATTILPGENAAEFEKLHRDLIAELAPNGAIEDDIVATIAHLLWRKQNLATFRIAELARIRRDRIFYEILPQAEPTYSSFDFGPTKEIDPAEREAASRTADGQARKELGEAFELTKISHIATDDHPMRELEVQDRLDAVIDKCLKRLLMVRGIKSISNESSSVPPKRIAGPSKAA